MADRHFHQVEYLFLYGAFNKAIALLRVWRALAAAVENAQSLPGAGEAAAAKAVRTAGTLKGLTSLQETYLPIVGGTAGPASALRRGESESTLDARATAGDGPALRSESGRRDEQPGRPGRAGSSPRRSSFSLRLP